MKKVAASAMLVGLVSVRRLKVKGGSHFIYDCHLIIFEVLMKNNCKYHKSNKREIQNILSLSYISLPRFVL